MSRVFSLWGKWRAPNHYQPLLCHMLDVAYVAERLCPALTACLPAFSREGCAPSDIDSNWITFLAGLHDLGKSSPAFQIHPSLSATNADVVRRRLTDAGLPCPRLRDRHGTSHQVLTPHGAITAFVLPDILTEHYGFSTDAARMFARVVGAHHGCFATSIDLQAVTTRASGGGPWQELRLAIVEDLASILGIPQHHPPAPDPATAVVLAGFISVVDWIGSMERYFRYAIAPDSGPGAPDYRGYASESSNHAKRAVHELHWLAPPALPSATAFESLFANIAPNQLQRAVIDVSRALCEPTLVIVEAPMGEGKTETAMYLAQHFAASLGQHGCYFALPTQATSNQMFSRVRAFLERGRTGEVNLQLLHGHAALSAEFQTLLKKGEDAFPVAVYGDAGGDSEHGEDTSTVVAAEWFTFRKRGLLAPFGVGTVDQALMAVLQTKHYFVRLFGLAGKTVIIDEVHAYDAYMTTLMERLLEWLASLGSSVVLLSATLPIARREALATSYLRGLGVKAQVSGSAAYPRLTWANTHGYNTQAIGASERTSRQIRLEWHDSSSFSQRIVALLANGGCAAVICNTVARAQQVYSSLKPLFCAATDDGDPELMLFHARYPFDERDLKEKRALVCFGRDGTRVHFGEGIEREVQRPRRAVIVATQVIEQSLDLDFDLMVSEFAPVDLLLQRAGRLHRHERSRPEHLGVPRMLLIGPDLRGGEIPGFGAGTEAVYDRHILLRSWMVLRGRESVDIPGDMEGFIEFVYGEKACPGEASEALREAWHESGSGLNAKRERYEGLAKENRIPAATDEALFEKNADLDEDSPDVHPKLQALTRLSDGPEVSVILLGADEDDRFHPDRLPHRDQVIALLRREVKITHPEIASALLREERHRPAGWRRSPFLRHHRLVRLDSMSRARIADFEILLDRELGLIFERASD
jgi:CRISPR-associated endonuclease/helicase Cas3